MLKSTTEFASNFLWLKLSESTGAEKIRKIETKKRHRQMRNPRYLKVMKILYSFWLMFMYFNPKNHVTTLNLTQYK